MKNFRKDEKGNFICEECGRIFKNKHGISLHVNLIHNGTKEYFDKWIKEDGEGICKVCGKAILTYKADWHGRKVLRIDRFNPSSKTCFNCGWVNRGLKLSDRVFKCQCGYVEDRDLNAAKNILKISRDESTRSNASGEQAIRPSMKEEELIEFLQNFIETYDYEFRNEIHYYFPDFLIPSLNLLVECKNHYLAKRDKENIECKKSASLFEGFRWILVIDKNYVELENKLNFFTSNNIY